MHDTRARILAGLPPSRVAGNLSLSGLECTTWWGCAAEGFEVAKEGAPAAAGWQLGGQQVPSQGWTIDKLRLSDIKK